MGADEPLDRITRSVVDGGPVDWGLAESDAASPGERASIHALRDVERLAEYHRTLQRSPLPRGVQEEGEARAGAPRGAGRPEQWGHLTLLELVSGGSTGDVWRAWDAWLHREVALKFLLNLSGPTPSGASESALLEEARSLARVRHTGVVAVYGIGEHEGRVGMWMELLRGSTLASEIERRGPLPVPEVLQIGLELSQALLAVELAGLLHRDIKPENIMLEPSARVVLTDFGLGKRRARQDVERWPSSGTPLFMAPELLEGEPASPRSDLYALGVTLRWALTGHAPFKARTLEALKTEAVTGPSAPLSAERPDAPAGLVQAIERAMAPRSEARWGSAAQLLAALETASQAAGTTNTRKQVGRRLAYSITGALLLAVAALVLPRVIDRSTPSLPVRLSVTAPPHTTLFPNAQSLAISPDGRLLVFAATDSVGSQRLWLRSLGALVARPLDGTEDGSQPFWSPDSRQIGFFAPLKLKKISIAGGPPEVLCNAPDPRGASWGKNGDIVFAPFATGPICRVSAEGGQVTEILRPDTTAHETALRWPQFLPDGRRFLFVSLPPRDGNFEVYAASLGSPQRKRVMAAGAAPICAGDGQLVFTSNGRLMCQKFDFRRLESVGRPFALGPVTSSDFSVGQPQAAASMNGVLVQPKEDLASTQLVWLSRSGKRLGVVAAPEGRYERVYFAPDGRRLLAERRDSPVTVSLWLIEPERGKARPFAQGSQSRLGGTPVWSPDGSRIAFSSNRAGRTNIYQRLTEGAGEEKLLYESDGQFKETFSWSPDGRYLVFGQADPVTQWDLWILPLEGKRDPVPYLRTRFSETTSGISPDGRWLAYSTNVDGKVQVYVRSFPTPGAEIHVSNSGGGLNTWTRDGKELLVQMTADRLVWSVPVSTGPTFTAKAPRPLFRAHPEWLWLTSTPAGDRFLASIPAGDVDPTTITVDLNWQAQIER